MGGWLSSWMVSPAMAWCGLLAISVPIIIHLLNKRRFKIVDWAAMDFLFEADKKNRRRVRLENLILLLLRCLAMALIGMLLARPFFPSQLTSVLFNTQQFERIVLLDDSLSMQVQTENRTAFDRAKESLISLARGLAENQTDDTLTVILTSAPDSAAFSTEEVLSENLNDIIDQINEISVSDRVANLETALAEIDRYVEGEKKNINRVVYVVTDLREKDWLVGQRDADGETEASEVAPNNLVKSIADNVAGTVVVDVGTDDDHNLTIKEIRPQETLVAGVPATFFVVVANQGESAVDAVKLRFYCGDQFPMEETIESIPAKSEKTIEFSYMFTPLETDDAENESTETRIKNNVASYEVHAEIVDASAMDDRLSADSVSYYAARVLQGIPTLVVDGDPSSDVRRSESIFLARALAPPGSLLSGNIVDVATFTEFETTNLSRYKVIALCNVDELSDTRLQGLEKWVANGGGLVIMPGDQTISDVYNQQMYRDGEGLSPIKLLEIAGDINQENWANFEADEQVHPLIDIFQGANNPIVDEIKIFNWWGAEVAEEQDGKSVNILARLSDPETTPAITEKAFGKGRVVAFTISADFDWTNWPSNLSYVPFFLNLNDYAAGNLTGLSSFLVGVPLRQPIDLSQYVRDVSIKTPDNEKANLQANPEDSEEGSEQSVWQISYDNSFKKGFYHLGLKQTDGQDESMLFAANVSADEGQLKRINLDLVNASFFGDNVKLVAGESISNLSVQGTRNEIWKWILLFLGGVLLIEQFLGWMFGRRR